MINYRNYENYNKYVEHQSSKIKHKKVKASASSFEYVKKFEEEFKSIFHFIPDGKIICLGARTGAEIQALRNIGFYDVMGIDLEPAPMNENVNVVKGDFHNIQFKNNSFECAYINCIDHCLDLRKVFSEIFRILGNNGILILRCEKMNTSGSLESCYWTSIHDIVDIVKETGFEDIQIEKSVTSDKRKCITGLKKC